MIAQCVAGVIAVVAFVFAAASGAYPVMLVSLLCAAYIAQVEWMAHTENRVKVWGVIGAEYALLALWGAAQKRDQAHQAVQSVNPTNANPLGPDGRRADGTMNAIDFGKRYQG